MLVYVTQLLVTPDVSSCLLSFCHLGCMKSLLDRDSCQMMFAEEYSFSSMTHFSVRGCIHIVCLLEVIRSSSFPCYATVPIICGMVSSQLALFFFFKEKIIKQPKFLLWLEEVRFHFHFRIVFKERW